ncbi:hypothetical protein PCANC_23256 [Puccinia coronata f. sp. avenae]|uniref:Uncharacterized protein n=1 Tax=Puccinia coronata f. sp. avenae TaxID=200324 RepID=A0A2N5TRL1_9BASI|nr:hypothetical protein PCANC_23256 [Puccinia coronata f. sp. avenae]
MVGIKVQSCPTPSPEFMRDDCSVCKTLNRSDDRILDYGELMVCKLQGFPVDRAHRRPRLLAAPHMKAEARDTRANTITNALLVSLSSVICEVKLWASTSGAILAGTRKRATKQYTDDVCRKFTWESFFQTQTAVTFENTKPAAQQVILRQTHHAASQQYLFFKLEEVPLIACKTVSSIPLAFGGEFVLGVVGEAVWALAINPRPLWAWAGKGGPGAQRCPLRTRWDRGPKGPGCEASSRSQQGFNFKGGCAAC